MSQNAISQVHWEGRFLRLASWDNWEYVTRYGSSAAVGIVPLTQAGQVVLVEQYRPPVRRRVIEIPAGLVGDVVGAEEESLMHAARRELFEETGYSASSWTRLTSGYSSPGLTDESITLFLAEGLEKSGPGGGDDSESIIIHEVGFHDVCRWLRHHDLSADLKLLAGLYAAQDHIAKRNQ